LAEKQQTAEKQRHDDEMARVHLETAKAAEEAAKATERTAVLEREAALLRFQLDQEIQKRAPRPPLTPEQKSAMLDELRGKILEIAIVVQNDPEAQIFAIQFFMLFQEAGAKIYLPEPPREDKWYAPAGLIMYSPLGTNVDILKDDPLYRALKRANLFGGTTSGPFVSGQLRGPIPMLIHGYNGPVLYIGQKPPF